MESLTGVMWGYLVVLLTITARLFDINSTTCEMPSEMLETQDLSKTCVNKIKAGNLLIVDGFFYIC